MKSGATVVPDRVNRRAKRWRVYEFQGEVRHWFTYAATSRGACRIVRRAATEHGLTLDKLRTELA